MNSSINPLENFLSSSSSLFSSMSFTDLLNTSYQQPPSPSELQFRSDLQPLQKLPNNFTNIDSIPPDLKNGEWFCSSGTEGGGGGVNPTGDGGEEMDSLFRVSSTLECPLSDVSRLHDPIREPNVSPMEEEEEIGRVKTTHSCLADSVLHEFCSDAENENVYDELGENFCRKKRKREICHELKGDFEELVNKMIKKQEDMFTVLLETVEQKEKDRITEELVHKLLKKQEDKFKVVLEKQESMYKVLLEATQQKEKDRITEEIVNKMMKKQEDMYKVLLKKQEDKYKVVLEKQEDMYKVLLETTQQTEKDRITEELVTKMMRKQEDMNKVLLEKQEVKYKVVLEKQDHMYKVLLETIEDKEKDRITREEIWRNLERERMRKEIEQMEKDRITREETWRHLEKERMGKEEERRAEDSRRSLAVLSPLGKFLGQQVIDNAGPLGQQEINTPQSMEQQKINIPQSSELISHDQSDQKKLGNIKWTKHEAQTLISVRMAVEEKFRTGAIKYLWEEISLGMASMGITKTAKQCSDKWVAMNRSYNRAETSGKTKAENAKTCPYFQELDMFYEKFLIDLEKAPKAETEAS